MNSLPSHLPLWSCGLFLLISGIIAFVLWLYLREKGEKTQSAPTPSPRKTSSWLWALGAAVLVLFIVFAIHGRHKPEQALRASHAEVVGTTWVKAWPDDGSDEVIVNGRPFTWDTNPKTDIEAILVTRMDGTTIERFPTPDKYFDLGGGIKKLRFKPKIPTTVYVTFNK
jgi:membrane protein implicated in regulation of membrane protease activity